MPKFTVFLRRTDIYTADVEIEADSRPEAEAKASQALADGSWDDLVGDEGDYQECYSEVDPYIPTKAGEVRDSV